MQIKLPMQLKVNEDLQAYIVGNIFPLYKRNDWGHQLWHIEDVIEKSNKVSSFFDIQYDMVYVIASFHDIGCYISRDNHETISANIFWEDSFCKNYFTEEQRQIIYEAIEDHRGSKELPPRSIYGKIMATADRFWTIEGILRSMHYYTLQFEYNLSFPQMVDRSYHYLERKYGPSGYAKTYIDIKDYQNFLSDVSHLLNHRDELAKKLILVDQKIRKEKHLPSISYIE